MAVLGVSPTESDIYKALGGFLTGILPAGTPVIQAQINRVPEPFDKDFVEMTPRDRDRLSTNVDSDADTFLTGSIAGNTLTVTAVAFGTIVIGSELFGPVGTVRPGTLIQSLVSPGVYTLSGSPQTVALGPLACGNKQALQPTKVMMQLDVHGPNSGDNAQIITTLFWDEYAAITFAALNPNITPLYADDPKQLSFVNDQNQYENRWVVQVYLQLNATVVISQQYAGALAVGLINVDASFPQEN